VKHSAGHSAGWSPEKENLRLDFAQTALDKLIFCGFYDVMDSCVSSCSSGTSMCYMDCDKCGFGLGYSLSASVGLLWGFLWPTLANLHMV
jgi:hypothetical protein